jgi:hypothetical protein
MEFSMTKVNEIQQEFVTNFDNPLLVVEQRHIDWRSEWVSPEIRNDKDRVIEMKMAEYS